jgi:hypothetical protein
MVVFAYEQEERNEKEFKEKERKEEEEEGRHRQRHGINKAERYGHQYDTSQTEQAEEDWDLEYDRDKCGVEKSLGITECPALIDCDLPIEVWVWEENIRAGTGKQGNPNQQLELSQTELPINKVLKKMIRQLQICRQHYTDMRWLGTIRDIDIETFEDWNS